MADLLLFKSSLPSMVPRRREKNKQSTCADCRFHCAPYLLFYRCKQPNLEVNRAAALILSHKHIMRARKFNCKSKNFLFAGWMMGCLFSTINSKHTHTRRHTFTHSHAYKHTQTRTQNTTEINKIRFSPSFMWISDLSRVFARLLTRFNETKFDPISSEIHTRFGTSFFFLCLSFLIGSTTKCIHALCVCYSPPLHTAMSLSLSLDMIVCVSHCLTVNVILDHINPEQNE